MEREHGYTPDYNFVASSETIEHKSPEKEDSDKVLALLKAKGLFTEHEDGTLILDDEVLRGFDLDLNIGRDSINRARLLRALNGVEVYIASDLDKDDETPLRKEKLLELPESLEDLYQNFDKDRINSKLLDKMISSSLRLESAITLQSGETIPVKRLRAVLDLKKYNSGYHEHEGDYENILYAKILSKLEAQGVLSFEGENLVIDKSAVEDISFEKFRFPKSTIIKALSAVEATPIDEYEDGHTNKERLVTYLPASAKEMADLNKDVPDYIIPVWEIGKQANWSEPIILESGDFTTTAELTVAQSLKEAGAYRDESTGKLEVRDDQTSEYKKFSSYNFATEHNVFPSALENGKSISFKSSGTKFFHKFLPNLRKYKTLNYGDFNRAQVSSEQTFDTTPRHISQTGDVGFSNKDGLFARYYLGKGNLFFTKPKEATRNNHLDKELYGKVSTDLAKVYRLTPDTAGIFIGNHGRQELMYTFDFASTEELQKKYEQIEQEKGLDKNKASAFVRFNVAEMEDRIKPYNFSEKITKWPEETEADFQKRAAQLNRPDFVVNECKNLFYEAGVGMQNLSWEDQLKIADVVMSTLDREKLVNFAKDFGINGLKALSSLNQTKFAKDVVFDIAEKFDKEKADKIFNKYAELLNKAQNLETTLQDTFGLDLNIKAKLAERGKKLLSSAKEAKDIEHIESAIDTMETDLTVLGQVARLMEKQKLPVDSIKELSLETISAKEMSAEDRQKFEELFLNNKTSDENYQDEIAKAEILQEFRADISEQSPAIFHAYKFNEKLAGYLKTKQLSETEMYVGNLNIDPEARGAFAKMFAESFIKTYGSKYDLVIDVIQGSSLQRWYEQEFDFEPTEVVTQSGDLNYVQMKRLKDAGQVKTAAHSAR